MPERLRGDAVNSDKRETHCYKPPTWYLFGPFPADRWRDCGPGLEWIWEWDEVTAALLGAFWVPVPVGWAWAGRGASGCWQRAQPQLLATDLGQCVCVSDLKSLLFSMVVNVMKKERKKKAWVSLRRQSSYLIALPVLPPFLFQGCNCKFLNTQAASWAFRILILEVWPPESIYPTFRRVVLVGYQIFF